MTRIGELRERSTELQRRIAWTQDIVKKALLEMEQKDVKAEIAALTKEVIEDRQPSLF